MFCLLLVIHSLLNSNCISCKITVTKYNMFNCFAIFKLNIIFLIHFSDCIELNPKQESSVKTYPLAIKMMFNYDAESNAMSILRAMSRETVPSRCVQRSTSKTDQSWLIGYI